MRLDGSHHTTTSVRGTTPPRTADQHDSRNVSVGILHWWRCFFPFPRTGPSRAVDRPHESGRDDGTARPCYRSGGLAKRERHTSDTAGNPSRSSWRLPASPEHGRVHGATTAGEVEASPALPGGGANARRRNAATLDVDLAPPPPQRGSGGKTLDVDLAPPGPTCDWWRCSSTPPPRRPPPRRPRPRRPRGQADPDWLQRLARLVPVAGDRGSRDLRRGRRQRRDGLVRGLPRLDQHVRGRAARRQHADAERHHCFGRRRLGSGDRAGERQLHRQRPDHRNGGHPVDRGSRRQDDRH